MSPASRNMVVEEYQVFFFNDTATTESYTLSLHDALPISSLEVGFMPCSFFRFSSDLSVAECVTLMPVTLPSLILYVSSYPLSVIFSFSSVKFLDLPRHFKSSS